MLGEVVGLTVQVTDCDACLVYLIERETNEIVLRASQVPHQSDLGNIRLKVGEGVTGWVVEHHSVVALAANAAADSRFKRFRALVEDTYEAFLSVPLITGGDVIGVINVHHREPHNHTSDEIALLTFVGEQMGGAIKKSFLAEENVRLQEKPPRCGGNSRRGRLSSERRGSCSTGTALPRKSLIFVCVMKAAA